MTSSADDWRRFTKTALALCLIVAPLLLLVSALMSTAIYDGDDEARYLASIADNDALFYTAGIIGTLGAVALVGAVLALVHLVRTHFPRYAIAAGGLALLGVLTFAGVFLTFTIVEYELAQATDREAMVALLQESEDGAASAPLFVTWIGTFLGVVLLAGALLRTHALPRWMPALLIVALLAVFFSESSWIGVITSALTVVAMGAIGLTILRSSLDAWERGELAGEEPPLTTAPPPAGPVPAH
jgi:hypothetical protein